MRALIPRFLNDLGNGILAPLTKEVRSDHTLCLELRGDYVNVYYRGGNLMKVEEAHNGYSVDFDENYIKKEDGIELPKSDIQMEVDILNWLGVSPRLKRAMDRDFAKKRNDERNFQQLVVHENNLSRIAISTDYYVCDIEYASSHGKFDMIAVHWPSIPHVRKQADKRRLVFIEMKYGDNALTGTAGLHDHIQDINNFLGDPDTLRCLNQDMVSVFNQKRKLEIVDCGKDLESFSDKPPILLLVLANHDPGKSDLSKALETLPKSPNADLRIATANFFGYGLYCQGVYGVEDFRERFRNHIHS